MTILTVRRINRDTTLVSQRLLQVVCHSAFKDAKILILGSDQQSTNRQTEQPCTAYTY